MKRVLHIIQSLSRGGAARALMAVAKYSREYGSYEHAVASLGISDPAAEKLAHDYGMQVIPWTSYEALFQEMKKADFVVVSWWNNPELNLLFRKDLPECRLLGWFHVAGDAAPQIITENVAKYFDYLLPCSPYTALAPGIQAIPENERAKKCAVVYGAADFGRLRGLTAKPHHGFNVGYIGTVHYLKMHPRYVPMSSAIEIPDVNFLVCGEGDLERCKADARALGAEKRFSFLGYVEDIRGMIKNFDVYGYPLCEDTYAAAEVNLQEVMFAGIPVVVFPYGGVKHLVQHNKTGLIVHTEQEYKEAIEYLYQHPKERARLGQGAKEYAERVFGAENAARDLNTILEDISSSPKRRRLWGQNISQPYLEQLLLDDDFSAQPKTLAGHILFLESLGNSPERKLFEQSLSTNDSTPIDEVFAFESLIGKCSELMKSNGVNQYRNYFRHDGVMWFWGGLCAREQGAYSDATGMFLEAIKLGFNHWRVAWYLIQSASVDQQQLALSLLPQLIQVVPKFEPALELQRKLSGTSASAAL